MVCFWKPFSCLIRYVNCIRFRMCVQYRYRKKRAREGHLTCLLGGVRLRAAHRGVSRMEIQEQHWIKLKAKVHTRTSKGTGIFAVTAPTLALSGYGRSEEEADSSLRKVFVRYISELRKLGMLESRLAELGVDFERIDFDPTQLHDWVNESGERELATVA